MILIDTCNLREPKTRVPTIENRAYKSIELSRYIPESVYAPALENVISQVVNMYGSTLGELRLL
jgi:hypothetical protein